MIISEITIYCFSLDYNLSQTIFLITVGQWRYSVQASQFYRFELSCSIVVNGVIVYNKAQKDKINNNTYFISRYTNRLYVLPIVIIGKKIFFQPVELYSLGTLDYFLEKP